MNSSRKLPLLLPPSPCPLPRRLHPMQDIIPDILQDLANPCEDEHPSHMLKDVALALLNELDVLGQSANAGEYNFHPLVSAANNMLELSDRFCKTWTISDPVRVTAKDAQALGLSVSTAHPPVHVHLSLDDPRTGLKGSTGEGMRRGTKQK